MNAPPVGELGHSSLPIHSRWQSATSADKRDEHPWPGQLFPRKPPQIPQTAETFQRFPDLPTEIRLQIWSYTAFPRAVEIREDKVIESKDPYLGYRNISGSQCSFTHFRTRTQLPATVSVCRESREIVRPRYKLCFGSAHDQIQCPSAIFFNPDVDTLYFRFLPEAQRWLPRPIISTASDKHAIVEFIQHATSSCEHARLDIEHVRRIAVSHRALDRAAEFAHVGPHLSALPAIEEFIIVVERAQMQYNDQVVLESSNESQDPDIHRLQNWIARLQRTQIAAEAQFNGKRGRVIDLKVMEARFENMYPRPGRSLLDRAYDEIWPPQNMEQTDRLQIEVKEDDWAKSVTGMLGSLSFN